MIEMDLRRNRIVASHREVAQERLDIQKAEERARIKAEKKLIEQRLKKLKKIYLTL